jgi:hypothetical protein
MSSSKRSHRTGTDRLSTLASWTCVESSNRTHASVREEVERRGGSLLELRGDEALVVFASPRQALRTAVDLQDRFVEEVESDPTICVPPFDDPRVRRALAFAIDRDELVDLTGARPCRPQLSAPPSELPRLRAVLSVHADPDESGRGTAPTSNRPEAWLTRPGAPGSRSGCGPGVRPAAPGTRTEHRGRAPGLGYPARVEVVEDPDEFERVFFDSRRRTQAMVSGWIADYPSAHNFLFTPACDSFVPGDPKANFNAAGFCDPEVDAMVEEPLATEATSPERAGALWAQVDRALTDQAPYARSRTPGTWTSSRPGSAATSTTRSGGSCSASSSAILLRRHRQSL